MTDSTKLEYGWGRIIGSCFAICIGFVLLLALFAVAGCQLMRSNEKSKVVADLPAVLEASNIQTLDVCNRLFGGYSFVAEIPNKVSKRIEAEGLQFFEGVSPSRRYALKEEKHSWRIGAGINGDGPPRGLLCLENYHLTKNGRRRSVINATSFVGEFSSRGAIYVTPDLGIVVGGFDPR